MLQWSTKRGKVNRAKRFFPRRSLIYLQNYVLFFSCFTTRNTISKTTEQSDMLKVFGQLLNRLFRGKYKLLPVISFPSQSVVFLWSVSSWPNQFQAEQITAAIISLCVTVMIQQLRLSSMHFISTFSYNFFPQQSIYLIIHRSD